MRVVLFIVGILVALNGAVWALQGAYLVPATFMRGPAWIGIGALVLVVGLVLIFKSLARKPAAAPGVSPEAQPRP